VLVPDMAPVEAPIPVTVNPDVAKLINDVIADCNVNPDENSIDTCKGNETETLGAYVEEKAPADFYASLGEMALTQGAPQMVNGPKVLYTIYYALGSVGEGNGRDWLTQNATKAAAQRFLKLDATMTDAQAMSGAAMGVAIPILAGETEQLDAVLESKAGGDAKSDLYDYFVTYGGVSVLPILDEVIKNDDSEDDRYAAVWSVGVALATPWSSSQATFQPSSADKARECDWARGYLSSSDPRVVDAAASAMGRCGGAYIDAALTALAPRTAAGQIDDGLEESLKDQCWTESSVDTVNGTRDQCDRLMEMLIGATKAQGITSDALQNALSDIDVVGHYGCGSGYRGGPGIAPDCARKAKETLTAFLTNPDKDVASRARSFLADFQ
jgi:hypothetical protein